MHTGLVRCGLLGLIAFGALAGAAEPARPKARDTKSALARLAASLKPGTWAVLNKDGDASGYGLKFTAQIPLQVLGRVGAVSA